MRHGAEELLKEWGSPLAVAEALLLGRLDYRAEYAGEAIGSSMILKAAKYRIQMGIVKVPQTREGLGLKNISILDTVYFRGKTGDPLIVGLNDDFDLFFDGRWIILDHIEETISYHDRLAVLRGDTTPVGCSFMVSLCDDLSLFDVGPIPRVDADRVVWDSSSL